jgi:putative transposase
MKYINLHFTKYFTKHFTKHFTKYFTKYFTGCVMARMTRLLLSNYPFYIENIGKKEIFRCNEDYSYYLFHLKDYCIKNDFEIHSYCLTPTTIKLLVTPQGKLKIDKMMQYMSKTYTRYYNRCYSSYGSIWHGKYRSSLINPNEYLLKCCHYIESIPLLKGLSKHIDEYKWSSYNSNSKKYKKLRPDSENIHNLNKNELNSGCVNNLEGLYKRPEDEFVRKLRMGLNGGWVIGNKEFCNLIQSKTNRRVTPLKRGGKRILHTSIAMS